MVNDFWSEQPRGDGRLGVHASPRQLSSTRTIRPGATNISARTTTRPSPSPRPWHDITGSTTKNSGFETSGYKRFTATAAKATSRARATGARPSSSGPPTRDQRLAAELLRQRHRRHNASRQHQALGQQRQLARSLGQLHHQLQDDPGLDQEQTRTRSRSQLRSGNILYYDQIPTDVPASAYTHTSQLQHHRPQPEVLEGVHRLRGRRAGATPAATSSTPANPAMSYGADYTFGTIKISTRRPGAASLHGL